MSFPIVYQKDCMQCGIACLATISEYFGKNIRLTFLNIFASLQLREYPSKESKKLPKF